LSALSFPSLSFTKKFISRKRFEGAGMQLLKDMRYGKFRALSQGVVSMQINRRGYQMYDSPDASVMLFKDITFPEGVEFDDAHSTVPCGTMLRFNESGSVSPYACTVAIKDSKGNSYAISIKVAIFTIDYKET
jgi:hypothetical protein